GERAGDPAVADRRPALARRSRRRLPAARRGQPGRTGARLPAPGPLRHALLPRPAGHPLAADHGAGPVRRRRTTIPHPVGESIDRGKGPHAMLKTSATDAVAVETGYGAALLPDSEYCNPDLAPTT